MYRVAQKLSQIGHSDTGTITIFSAVFLPVALGLAAFAIDLGSMYTQRRHAQGVVDLAAMAAANDLPRATDAAIATLQANGFSAEDIVAVETGRYEADASIAHRHRFTPGATNVNAARVTLRKPAKTYFATLLTSKSFELSVAGMAANEDVAAFAVGSRLAAVRDGIANEVLGQLLGTQVALTVMDYEALANANVQLLSFMDQLNSELHLNAATYDDVLNAKMTVGSILSAVGAVGDSSSDPHSAAAIKALLANHALANKSVDLTRVINLGPVGKFKVGDANAALDAEITLLQLITGIATVADGVNQIHLDLTANIPGVAKAYAEIAIGERPRESPMVTVGGPESQAHTAQTRLKLVAEIGGSGLLAGTAIRLPVYAELAPADARLARISCSQGDATSVDVAATPGVANVRIGEVTGGFSDFHRKPTLDPAVMIRVPTAKVYGMSEISAQNISETQLSFSEGDIENGVIHRADSSQLSEAIVSSLLKRLRLQVKISGMKIGINNQLDELIATALADVAKPLDSVVHDILTAAGVHLGEADVRVHGVRCGSGGMLAG